MKNFVKLLVILFILFLQSHCSFAETFQFNGTTNRLKITTSRLELDIERGAIVYVKDVATGQVLVNTSATTNFPSDPRHFIGFVSKDSVGNHAVRRPGAGTFSVVAPNQGRLTYKVLDWGDVPVNGSLVYDITVDGASGEIVVAMTGTEAYTDKKPFTLDIPIMNFAGKAVILGNGAKYARAEPACTDDTDKTGSGYASPSMAVLEGASGVLAAWSETGTFTRNTVRLLHNTTYDHVVCKTNQDLKQTNPQVIKSPAWRLGTYPNWTDAARRWKVRFEERYGAKPLWQNPSSWVRRLHAMSGWFDCTGCAPSAAYDAAERSLDYVSDYLDLSKLLVHYPYFSHRINILAGDLTSVIAQEQAPVPDVRNLMEERGVAYSDYFYYTLIFTEAEADRRVADFKSKGWIPSTYTFNPITCTEQEWYSTYWQGIKRNYDSVFDWLHPGAAKTQKYVVDFLHKFMLDPKYGIDTFYLDCMGLVGNAESFAWMAEGKDWNQGDYELAKLLHEHFAPYGKAFWSEYAPEWIVPYTFMDWNGDRFAKAAVNGELRLNHPLRAALYGSYHWAMEQEDTPVKEATLVGTLPRFPVPHFDGKDDAGDKAFRKNRARLFCEEDLFYDLPLEWKDPEALAYYRSLDAYWYKFKMIGSDDYGYFKEMPDGSEVLRLSLKGGYVPDPTPTPISDITAPSCGITSPATSMTLSGTVDVSVSASDDQGVTRVELYLDETLYATDNSAPYSFSWDTRQVADGPHTLRAWAYDAAGNSAASSQVTVTVQNQLADSVVPQATIASPMDGSVVNRNFRVKVRAKDNVLVERVELYADGALQGFTDSAADTLEVSFTLNAKKLGKGQHKLLARAVDAAGNKGESLPITVMVR